MLLAFGLVLLTAVMILISRVIYHALIHQREREQRHKSCSFKVTAQIDITVYYPHDNISIRLDSYPLKTHPKMIWKYGIKRPEIPVIFHVTCSSRFSSQSSLLGVFCNI